MNVVKNKMGPNPRVYKSRKKRSKCELVYLKGTALKVGPRLGNMI